MGKKNQLITVDSKATLSNILNEMCYEEKMTLQELRFFLVYLSKINPKQPDKTEVTFSLQEYGDLLGVELNEQKMKAVTRKLMRYVVSIRPKVLQPGIRQHIMNRQIFSKSDLYQREIDGEWLLTFECHNDLKEHLFDLKSEFTSLEVWNVVNLGNFQDARLYMLLCQYRGIGSRTIELDELKKMLCIKPEAYPEYKIFSRDVLKKAQKSLKQYTDIEFDFRAVGRPAKAVCFTIRKNKTYQLPKFLQAEETKIIDVDPDQTSLFDDDELEERFGHASKEDTDISFIRDALGDPAANLSVAKITELRALAYQYLVDNKFELGITALQREEWLYSYVRSQSLYVQSHGYRNFYAYVRSAIINNHAQV